MQQNPNVQAVRAFKYSDPPVFTNLGTECGKLTALSIGVAILAGVVVVGLVYFAVRWVMKKAEENHENMTEKQLKKSSKAAKQLKKIIPELVGDFKVFLGMYQILCSMGITMQISYPSAFEHFLDAIRSLVNINLLELPGFACRLRSTVYAKFWVAVGTLPAISLCMLAWYYFHTSRRKQVEGDKGQSDQSDSANDDYKSTCIGRMFLIVFLAYSSICSNVLAVFHCFSVDDTTAYIVSDFRFKCSGSVYDAHYTMAVIFTLVYPVGIPICLGFLIIKHKALWCFRHTTQVLWCVRTSDVSDAISEQVMAPDAECIAALREELAGMKMKDLKARARAEGVTQVKLDDADDENDAKEFIIKMVLEKADKAGNVPEHIEKLYRDYKDDCSLWEVYQYAQKVALVGVLGFVSPGSLTQATLGLIVTELMLMAFVWCVHDTVPCLTRTGPGVRGSRGLPVESVAS